MNIGDIAEHFIRAAEIDRATREHVGPALVRSLPLPYVHSRADKNGWGKEDGDQLVDGADPLAEERKAFWERIGVLPSAHEITELEAIHDWLTSVGNDKERRALLAWARSKVGGKSFRSWCFKTEGIHPNTGRDRKNRALEQIAAILARKGSHNSETGDSGELLRTHEIDDVSHTIAEDAGERDTLNSWLADGAFAKVLSPEFDDFSWAAKRNERRRQREKQKRKKA
ncbi:hypothetical protein [Aminobacter carboxidus]|uniref:Uncharacterized protein n=1 Tax=Aminobacter carboxidus TaxID=376165 RepID=A0ABR9GWR7_9HYPH|nr:hypothetical protein [Aminobacter carboxidus]MBE1208128.1 hypothetical protein [Aminobacter carboxidus]